MAKIWPARHGLLNYISDAPSDTWLAKKERKLVILGATGSIGTSALALVRAYKEKLPILALAASTKVQELAILAKEFLPLYLAVKDATTAKNLAEELAKLKINNYQPNIVFGLEGYRQLATLEEADLILSAQSGSEALSSVLAAALAGKVIALANKETLVMAGDLLRQVCQISKAVILPVDSEHNGLFQCLAGHEQDAKELIITASGGPFYGKEQAELERVTKAQALQHPKWQMGPKITIDSATMMNKALEIIEAAKLFGLGVENLNALVHPQAIVHALVRFYDGTVLAQMAMPDMRSPIAHCLFWPACLVQNTPQLNFLECAKLEFLKPDRQLSLTLDLAKQALQCPGATIVLNAANQMAVELFLADQCQFVDILKLNQLILTNYLNKPSFVLAEKLEDLTCQNLTTQVQIALAEIIKLDRQSREQVLELNRTGELPC